MKTDLEPIQPTVAAISPGIIGTLAAHGLSLVLPVCTLTFLATGPHPPLEALLWTLPVWLFILVDFLSPPDRRAPPANLPSWPFTSLLYLLAGLQIANIACMVRMVSDLEWSSASEVLASLANLLAVRVLVGTNSCCAGIAPAHELIHRRGRVPRSLGRVLLCLVCYEHFAVEHLRGHHRYVGTHEDPATARLGESYGEFWRRTALAQFRNAWRLESERLGPGTRFRFSRAMLRHEVLIGVTAEAVLILFIVGTGGIAAAAMFLLQALAAVRLLETVNYFQHWGLERRGPRFDLADAWTSDSWFTRHVFMGLARHGDHHRCGTKPYHVLLHSDRGPRLPYGYFCMALLAKSFNRRFQLRAMAELEAYRWRGAARNSM